MELRTRNTTGAALLLLWLPVYAQEATSAKKPVVAACASCPAGDSVVVVSGDPTWLIASFVAGIIVGVVLTKLLSAKK